MTGKSVCAARQQLVFDGAARKGFHNAFLRLVIVTADLPRKLTRVESGRTVEAARDSNGNCVTIAVAACRLGDSRRVSLAGR